LGSTSGGASGSSDTTVGTVVSAPSTVKCVLIGAAWAEHPDFRWRPTRHK
jgi:hypothetical protein